MTAIQGEYTSFKHIKTRKAVVLEIEIPEEYFQNVINTLGMPIGGESKPVGIALLANPDAGIAASKKPIKLLPMSEERKEEARACVDRMKARLATQNNNELSINEKSTGHNLSPVEKSEGEKLRIRACCLCKEDSDFQLFASQGSKLSLNTYDWKEYCRTYICNYCNITSRLELRTNTEAQNLFKELDQKFKDWQYANQYPDNLSRE